jgi:hypothetical protein
MGDERSDRRHADRRNESEERGGKFVARAQHLLHTVGIVAA